MKNLNIGVHIAAAEARSTVERIIAADAAGVDTAWMTQGGVAPEAASCFSAAAMSGRADRIAFGTSIYPTFPRHPLSLAAAAMTVDQLAPGRLKLGVGPSHKPSVEGTYNIPFVRPQEHLREYLTILSTLLKTGEVNFQGKRLSAVAKISRPTQVKVMASALRPNGFRLCGELAEGGISWMCPAGYIRDVAVPALKEGAATANRPTPPMVMHVPIVVSEDGEAIWEAAQRQIGFYPRVPYYSQMLQDAGFPEAKEGTFSRPMSDELVISGNEEAVASRIKTLPEFGADEIICTVLNLGGESRSYERTVELLGALAKRD
jgi:F420-dependent oxidoreductase-like protein